MKFSLHIVLASAILAAPVLSGLTSPVLAQESYPRMIGGADDTRVEYGPAPVTNIIGGGTVRISIEEEGRVAVMHESPGFAQARNDGRVPVMLGGEADHSVTWVAPVPTRQASRAVRPQG